MKKVHFIIIALGLGVLPLFQNCGTDAASKQTGGLYVGEAEPDCLATVVDCGPKPEYLEITIDLSNPTVFSSSNTSFTVYGRCNEGNYNYSAIRYRLFAATDLDNAIDEMVIKKGSAASGYCMNGKYSETISLNGLSDNTSYVLTVQMLGYETDGGEAIANLQSNGSASFDFSKE